MFDYVGMGNRMLIARLRKNLKQSEMGRILGLSQPSYSDIETGKREVTISQLYIIASALEVSVTWLLGVDNFNRLTDSDLLKIEEYKRFLISQHENKKNI